jgi:hypothetical protein
MSGKTTKVAAVKSELAIVNRAIASLEGSDKENLEKFYNGVIKDLEKKISTKKRFIANEEIKHNDTIEDLKLALEDAEQEVEDAKISVSPAGITTNADRTANITTFWNVVNTARRKVARIEADIQSELDAFKSLSEVNALEIEQLTSDLEDLKK